MTSGALADAVRVSNVDDERQAGPEAVPEIVRRRLTPYGNGGRRSWLVTATVVFVAGVLRLVGITHPRGLMFDEIYYAAEARAMLEHGVEWKDGAAEFVVHPPLGKWLIGLGELVFGYNELGWRIAAAIAGTLSVLILVRVAQRMFGSTVLAGTAGLLLALDGMHFVLSRTALLDIFLMLFVLAAFACLVADRDHRRRHALAALEAGREPVGSGPAAITWRLAAAVLTGCACAVKWSGVWALLLMATLVIWWEISLRRSLGTRLPWRYGLTAGAAWTLAFATVAGATYLASWTGWFLTDDGFDRHWLALHGRSEPPVLGPLVNLWQYHREAFRFHTTLTTKHPYQSWPWQWLLLGRPVLFYSDFATKSCGADSCASEVLLLGTPPLWWSFLPALTALTWLGIARRDWRAGAIGLAAAAGIVPWFAYELDMRTMYNFYALPAEPFLVLAVVYVLGALVGPALPLGEAPDRRLVGVAVAALYVGLVALAFAYFYPIYTGNVIAYADWWARMWLGMRWV